MDVNDRVFRTYEGWKKKKGRCVRKGEKAVGYVGETAVFGKDQTGKELVYPAGYRGGSEYGYDSYYGSGGVDHNGYY